MAHAAHRPPPGRGRRRIAIGIVLAVVLAFVVGFALTDHGGERAGSSPAASGPTSPSATTRPTHAPKPSTSASPALEDGRHFVFVKALHGTPPDASMTFDLAYFLTGDAANQAAAAHGDETPVPNDYYIVNDNPLLRTMPIAATVEIDAIDWTHCCEPASVSYADWAASIAHPTEALHGSESGWWITIADGRIEKIQEQYTP